MILIRPSTKNKGVVDINCAVINVILRCEVLGSFNSREDPCDAYGTLAFGEVCSRSRVI